MEKKYYKIFHIILNLINKSIYEDLVLCNTEIYSFECFEGFDMIFRFFIKKEVISLMPSRYLAKLYHMYYE